MRILKHLLTYLRVVLPLEILGIIILPIALLLIPRNKENLPKYLRWFDNHEFYFRDTQVLFIDGLAGYSSYRKRNGVSSVFKTGDDPFWRLWWVRYKWLAFRNPLNYFQYKYLGFFWPKPIGLAGDYTAHVVDGEVTHIVKNHDLRYIVTWMSGSSRIETDNPGTYKVSVKIEGKEYWEYMSYKPIFNTGWVIRIRMGWKIDEPSENKPGDPIQWVFIPFSIKRRD